MGKSFYKTAKGILQLIRPFNCLGSAVVIPAVFLMSSDIRALIASADKVITMSLITFLVCAAGNALNDYYDFHVDKINRRARPLPSGVLQRNQAAFAAVVFNLAALYFSYRMSGIIFLIVLSAEILLAVYNKHSKKMGLLGNFLVSFVFAESVVAGGVVAGNLQYAVYFAASALFINLSRELVKDIEDMKGDKTIAKASFPLRHGIKKTVALASLSALIGTVFMVYLQKFYSPLYLILIIPAVYSISKIIVPTGKLDAKKAGMISKSIKTSGTIAILAMLVSGIFR